MFGQINMFGKIYISNPLRETLNIQIYQIVRICENTKDCLNSINKVLSHYDFKIGIKDISIKDGYVDLNMMTKYGDRIINSNTGYNLRLRVFFKNGHLIEALLV